MKKFIFNNRLYLFRLTDGKIYVTDTLSGKSEVIFEGAAGDFDISCDKNGKIYVLCQNRDNYFYILKNEGGGWSEDCILESTSREAYNKSFSIISSGVVQNAFYILKKQSGCALIHHIIADGAVPCVVADFSFHKPYYVISAPSGDIYCIYQQDGYIGYKLFRWRDKKWAEFVNICEERGAVEFISAVYNYNTDTVHTVYSASFGGKHRVIYTGARTHEIISNGYTPIQPAIFINNEIYITFNFAGRLLMCKSSDEGGGFSSPEYYFDGSFARKELASVKVRNYGVTPELSDCMCYGYELLDGGFSICLLDEKIKGLKKPRQSFYTEKQSEVEELAGITQPEKNPGLEKIKAELERLKSRIENNFDKKLVEIIAKRLDDIELRLKTVEERTETASPEESADSVSIE